jgi:hypothetical protein
LDRLPDANRLFGFVAHVLVFADQPVRLASCFPPLQFNTLFAGTRLRVTAFRAGDDDHVVTSGLDIECALIDGGLDVVAAHHRVCGVTRVGPEPFGHQRARIAVPPGQFTAHPDAGGTGQGRRCPGVGGRAAQRFDHEVDRLDRWAPLVDPLIQLADPDEDG